MRTQQANLQSQAAISSLRWPSTEHLLVQIDNLKVEQASVEKDIKRYQASRKEAEASSLPDRARLVELLGE